MYQWCFALLSLLVFSSTTVSSASCNSFESILVNVVDYDNLSFNTTVNGCAESKKFSNIKVKRLSIRLQAIPILGKDSVRHMEYLQEVSFWGNKMNEILPGAFRDLSSLKKVKLLKGNIKEVPRGVFDAIPSMETLGLHSNEIDVVEDKAFANLVSLKRIVVSHNKLEYWNKEWFFNTTNLEIMDFKSNRIKTIPRSAFASLVKLKQIIFDFNEISVIQADAFEGITKLDYLGLRYNRLTEIKGDAFPNKLSIERFFLDANYLNFLPNEVLKKVSVKYITMDNNPWKCPCWDIIAFWLYSTNGTMRKDKSCTGKHVPVCSLASSSPQTCLEVFDIESTERFLASLARVNPPLPPFCARLDLKLPH